MGSVGIARKEYVFSGFFSAGQLICCSRGGRIRGNVFLADLAGLPYRIPVAYCLTLAKGNPCFLWHLAENDRS